jgi:alcohol dehydrogenase (cytochrome c)
MTSHSQRPRVHLLATAIAIVLAAIVLGGQASELPPVLRDLKPVTDETLRRPSPDDWLHWRRTYDGWGYSPLHEINRRNVRQLQHVWSWAMDPGTQVTTPLVHDGVMYLASPNSIVQALDAANGDLLWEFRDTVELPPVRREVRGLSIYEDMIYLNTADARIIALNVRTGKKVWDVQVADPKQGFRYSASSLIVRGKVISGLMNNNFVAEKNAVTAHDAKTGKELWRTRAIALPGEPGGDSWGDVPAVFRAGADMWITGGYDPELDLIYWSTAQAKPFARAARGTEGDALYSNSTLALDPDDGKLVWFRQWVPGEQNDMDEVFEHVLIDRDGPTGRKSLFKMGKLGILWEADRRTGELVNAVDLGYQNLVDIDKETFKVTYRPGMTPVLGKPMDHCPHISGLHSWRAMAYQPDMRALIFPSQLACNTITYTDVKKTEGGGGVGIGNWKVYLHPKSGGNLGELMAMDLSGKVLWSYRQRATFNSTTLTTAGALAFVGDWNRYIDAFDVKTGDLLWQTRLGASVQGGVITYAVRGRQYLAVPVGTGASSWANQAPMQATPELTRPRHGNAIVVFALPQAASQSRRR